MFIIVGTFFSLGTNLLLSRKELHSSLWLDSFISAVFIRGWGLCSLLWGRDDIVCARCGVEDTVGQGPGLGSACNMQRVQILIHPRAPIKFWL